jgi:hypothetical protein
MPRRADPLVAQALAAVQWSGAGSSFLVQSASNNYLYCVYVDTASDVSFRRSTDGGLTWGTPTVVYAGTVTNLSIWYDRWSGYAADLIHCAYTESGGSDTLYRTINTASSDALSTQTTIFAGSSRAAGGHLSIVRAKGGNVYCKTVIDAGSEGGFYRLPSANVPNGAWDAARTVDETIATLDQMYLLPDLTAADTNDIMAVFWDASASELSRKLYDDSANSWAEASIATSMTCLTAATAFPNFDVAVDLTNNRVVLVAWSNVDTLNADLRCWTITNSAISEVTNVVLNSTDDQGLAAISIDSITGEWTVAYAGKSDGSETCWTALNIYCKGSRDSGSTWGPETKLSSRESAAAIKWLVSCPWIYRGEFAVLWFNDISLDEININIDHSLPRSVSIAGVM